MDDKWFKQKQKMAGVTAETIATSIGRDRSTVSRIYAGTQKMSLDWAKAFSVVLDVPLAEVLVHAGVTDNQTAQTLKPGFSESDAAPWLPKEGQEGQRDVAISKALGADSPGIDIWQLRSNSMSLAGYLAGDKILVDGRNERMSREGDVVIAQVYDWKLGAASTLLRRFSPPVLVANSADPADTKVYVVDNDRVVIKGTVIASWRTT